MSKKNGPQPKTSDDDFDRLNALRDHFAGQALSGMCARVIEHPELVARQAYEYANEMIIERAKR